MELTNEQRKYLGMELIDPAWEKVEICTVKVFPALTGIKSCFRGDVFTRKSRLRKTA